MKLENQVCTRQQAERLHDLGIAGKALFGYCQVNPGGHNHEQSYSAILPAIFELAIPDLATTFEFDAWTTAELGRMLPETILLSNGREADFKMVKDGNYWEARYVSGYNDTALESAKTEASARAKLLIYLLEVKLTTAAEVNARLEKEGGV